MILRRWISRSSGYNSAGNLRSLNSACGRESPPISNNLLGWLMPPPPVVGGGGDEVVGYSHGWVALFNKRNNHLFLSDPLSHRTIKLPPIDTLPDPELNLDLEGQGSVTKVILSSPPEEDDCRAMMTFGAANRLAFCVPGRSSDWTPIGKHFFDSDHKLPLLRVARVHEDLVYCSRRKLFTSITSGHLDLRYFSFKPLDVQRIYMERHDWDIQDPNSPEIVGLELLFGKNSQENRWLDVNKEFLEKECVQIPHIVYAEHSDQLFIVVQFVRVMSMSGGWPLGYVPRCEVKGLNGVFGGKTCGFLVFEINDGDDEDEDEDEDGVNKNKKKNKIREWNDQITCKVVEDLNGMAMFVGINHSYAILADSAEFKPNCIYFSDAKRIPRLRCADDAGVFNYATKTISPFKAPPPSASVKLG